MSDVVNYPINYHTEAVPSDGGRLGKGSWTSSYATIPRHDDFVILTFAAMGDHYVVSGGTLAQCIMLGGSWRMPYGSATSSKPSLLIRDPNETIGGTPDKTRRQAQTAAQAAVEGIRSVAKLTHEEIAPLAGVSRRSIQAWLAGEPISARKEHRLRAVLDALQELAAPDPQVTRGRLFDRQPGQVSAYDLLAEGLFKEAVDCALGRRRVGDSTETSQSQNLYAQLDHHEGRVELPTEPLDRRLSGRLRR